MLGRMTLGQLRGTEQKTDFATWNKRLWTGATIGAVFGYIWAKQGQSNLAPWHMAVNVGAVAATSVFVSQWLWKSQATAI
jgi:hypothetical protein